MNSYDQWKTESPYDGEPDYDNSEIEKAFRDYPGPYAVYRAAYKYTDCGPTVGFSILDPEDGTETLYCEDLGRLGSWKDMARNGLLVTAISVSSIVEGVEQCTTTHWIEISQGVTADDISEEFDDAIESVNREADAIWQATHGCEGCAALIKERFGYPVEVDEDGLPIDEIPVMQDCPLCCGNGVPI